MGDENKSAETNICQIELDLYLSGKYMEPLSSCIWNIRKENESYYIEDCSGNVTKIIYYGNGIFKSADKRQVYTVLQNNIHIPKCIFSFRTEILTERFIHFIETKSIFLS